MAPRPKSATIPQKSNFERNFETKQTFKRNRQFLNLQRMNSLEKQFQLRRRKPIKSDDEHLINKINSSFVVSTAIDITERTERSRAKSPNKSRSNSFAHPLTQRVDPKSGRSTMYEYSPNPYLEEQQLVKTEQNGRVVERPHKKSRSFSMQKMTSRQYHHKLRNKQVPDQRLFSNFKQFKIGDPLSCNFERTPGKILDNSMKHIKLGIYLDNTDLQYDTQQLYQQFYFKKQIMRVDYKSEHRRAHNNPNNRIFFKKQRPQNLATTDLSPQKIDKGLKVASNFKQSNIKTNAHLQYYRDSGKQLPSQFDMRFMNQLTNHWKQQNETPNKQNNNKTKRPKLQYSTRKMKSDMKNQRESNIRDNKKKKIYDKKQMCVDKYFRYYDN